MIHMAKRRRKGGTPRTQDPTPDEIQAKLEAIRSGWDKVTRRRRRCPQCGRERWEVPICHLEGFWTDNPNDIQDEDV